MKPDGGDWQYIGIPVKKHARACPINEVEARDEAWKEKVIGQLKHYKKKARYFKETISFLEDCFGFDENNLSKINIQLLKSTCSYIGLEFNYSIYSEMNLMHRRAAAGEWALYISEGLSASTYINLPGGRAIFDEDKFKDKAIKLKFIEADLSDYYSEYSKKSTFFAGLSIIDVLMYQGKEGTKQIIENYKLLD